MKFRSSLKGILTFHFMMAAVIPILLIGLVMLNILARNLKHEITYRNLLLARSIAGEVQRFLNEPMALLGQVQEVIEEKRQLIKKRQINEYLETIIRHYAFFDQLMVLDQKGVVRHMAPPSQEYIGIDMTGQAFYKCALERGKSYWSPSFISIQTGKATLTLARPFKQGMVVGYLNLAALNTVTAKVKLGSHGYAAMADQEGVTIAHANSSFISQRLNVRNLNIIQQGLAGREGNLQYRFRDHENLGSVAVVPQTGWPIVVVQPLEEAYAPVRRLQNIFWMGLAFGVLLALLSVLAVLRKTLKPLSVLVERARKVARGDYRFDPQPESYAEINELAEGFKTMARAVMSREKALKESEEKYRLHFENVTDVAYSIDRDLMISGVSPSVEKELGYRPEELVGRPFQELDIVAPESMETALADTVRVFEGEPVSQSVYVFIAKDGTRKFGEVSGAPLVKDGKITGLVSVARDITDRICAQEALAESEEKYRLLVENADDAIFIVQDEVIKFHNRRTLEMTGYSADELSGIPFVNLIHPEDREMVVERHVKRLRGDEFPSTYSFRIITRDGKELWAQLNTVLITWEEHPATLNFLRDIAEQKKMEIQLLQANKMEAMGTLAGGIAHDFNNLLMGIQGRTSLMLADEDHSHRDLEHLRGIEDYVKNAADLTKQLLGFARGGKYETRPTDLNDLIRRQNRMFGRARKEISIHEKCEKDLWSAEVDRGQIDQALLNLYVNAWQAMPAGGDLYVATKNVVIDESFIRPFKVAPGRYVKISVIDTGMGMDETTRERIFDPFFTTKEMGRGTGLGMASVYGIVKNHSGFIDVYSQKGHGTTFDIFLPASEAEVRGGKSEVSEEVTQGEGTILHVDDETMIVDVGSKMIQKFGYHVVSASTGGEAIEVYEANRDKIDLVILDMIMPGMGGGKVYDRLKSINPEVKVLLSSGYSIDGQAREILNRGCNGFIQKPFNMKQLSRKIKEVLRG